MGNLNDGKNAKYTPFTKLDFKTLLIWVNASSNSSHSSSLSVHKTALLDFFYFYCAFITLYNVCRENVILININIKSNIHFIFQVTASNLYMLCPECITSQAYSE